MFIYILRAHSGLCNRKKEKKQAFLNIKNDETFSFYMNIFFRNLNSFLGIIKNNREDAQKHLEHPLYYKVEYKSCERYDRHSFTYHRATPLFYQG